MKFIYTTIFAAILLAGLGYLMNQDPGYVMIAYRHTTFESTLWFALLAIILFVIAINVLWETH